MNSLLIHGEPVGPFQRLYVLNGQKIIETLGITVNDLEETVFALVEKYNITHINLSGAKAYMEGIEQKLKTAGVSTYSIDDLTFQYV